MANASGRVTFCWRTWLSLLAAALITDVGAAIHGSIFPNVKFVHRESDVTFYCKLNTTGLIDNVFWNVSVVVAPGVVQGVVAAPGVVQGVVAAPGAVQGVVNDTVSKVTIFNLLADTLRVTCFIHVTSLQRLDEIVITSGYPPETPRNVSCIYFHKRNVTCRWIPGKDPQIPTTYRLTVLHDTEKKYSATKNSGFFPDNHEQFRREYNVRLEVYNELGNATREFTVNTATIVKLDPPKILSLKALPAKDPSFLISWRRPTLAPDELEVKCGLRYKQLQDDQWDYTSDLYMEKEKKISYSLCGLYAYTEYAVSVRCIGSIGQVWWSEWSGALIGRTAEQAPSHSVELWRAISSIGQTRLVYLKWKESSSIRSPGITLGYNVQWFPEGRMSDSRNKTTTNNEMRINISEEAHVVVVVHFNSAGWSPRATLRIPASGEKSKWPKEPLPVTAAREVVCGVQVSAAAEDVAVTWTVTDLHFQRFVLDWCIDSGDGPCNISFQYVENSSRWTIEKGILEPYKRYKLSVYPVQEDRAQDPCTTYFYLKEGAPLHGPNAKVTKRKKTEVTIQWDPLRPDETNGFITAFSIVYKPPDGPESVVTVNSDIYEYSLRSLTPDTLYIAYILANTSAGSTAGNHFQFHTLADGSHYIGALTGTLGTCLLLLLVLAIAYKYKKDKIKSLLWPVVPDPSHSSIAEWRPDWLQAVPLLNPVQTDGALHCGDLRILHAVYVNDKRDRELLLSDSWGDTEAAASMDEPHIVVNYATTVNCMESAACALLLQSELWPAAAGSAYSRSLHDNQPAAAEGTPPHLEPIYSDDTAAVNPYLKNSVRTREMLTGRTQHTPSL